MLASWTVALHKELQLCHPRIEQGLLYWKEAGFKLDTTLALLLLFDMCAVASDYCQFVWMDATYNMECS